MRKAKCEMRKAESGSRAGRCPDGIRFKGSALRISHFAFRISLRSFVHQVGHVGTADERARKHGAKAQALAVRSVFVEDIGVNVLFYREMLAGGLQILTYRHDIHVVNAEVVQQMPDLIGPLASYNHKSRLRE